MHHCTQRGAPCRATASDDSHPSLFPDAMQTVLRERMAALRAQENMDVSFEAIVEAQRQARPPLPHLDVDESELRALAEWHEAAWDLLRHEHRDNGDAIA